MVPKTKSIKHNSFNILEEVMTPTTIMFPSAGSRGDLERGDFEDVGFQRLDEICKSNIQNLGLKSNANSKKHCVKAKLKREPHIIKNLNNY